jgi:flagellar biosynthetic protein FliP
MVAVMFAGMFALMAPTGWVLSAFGASRLSPAMNVFEMAVTMTAPMVVWMRYRGHAWRPNIEMATSMLIPTFVVMGLLWGGVGGSGSLMVPEHAGMLFCMLVAMLLRRDEYSCETHHGQAQPAIAV